MPITERYFGQKMWGDIGGFRFDPQFNDNYIYSAITEYSNVEGFQAKKGYPIVFHVVTGTLLWESLRDQINGEPTVAAGQLFISKIFNPDGSSDGYYSGFASLSTRTGQVTTRAPSVKTNYSHTPTVVHINCIYHPDPYVGFNELQ